MPLRPVVRGPMTDQLILGIAVAIVALLIAYEAVETWRWRGFQNRPPSRFRIVRFVRRAVGGLVSIITLRRLRTRRVAPEPTLTADDVSRRLGDAPPGPVHLQPGRIVVSGARMPIQPATQPVQPIPPPRQERPSRLRLVRDTIGAALVMGGFVVVFANLMPAQRQGAGRGRNRHAPGDLAGGRRHAASGEPVAPLGCHDGARRSHGNPDPGAGFVRAHPDARAPGQADREAGRPAPAARARDAGSEGHPEADEEADAHASAGCRDHLVRCGSDVAARRWRDCPVLDHDVQREALRHQLRRRVG